MAVASTLQLPGQPGVGFSRLIPLNGDGFTSPKSIYELQVSLTGDATGGLSTITVDLDPRYLSMILRMDVVHLGSTTADEFQLIQRLQGSSANSSVVGTLTINDASNFDPTSGWWDPPTLLPIDQISSIIVNVDTNALILTAWIYNFDINALNTIPLAVLLRSFPRASAFSS